MAAIAGDHHPAHGGLSRAEVKRAKPKRRTPDRDALVAMPASPGQRSRPRALAGWGITALMTLLGVVGLYVGGVFGSGTSVLVRMGVIAGVAWIELSVLTLAICVASSRSDHAENGRRAGSLRLVEGGKAE